MRDKNPSSSRAQTVLDMIGPLSKGQMCGEDCLRVETNHLTHFPKLGPA